MEKFRPLGFVDLAVKSFEGSLSGIYSDIIADGETRNTSYSISLNIGDETESYVDTDNGRLYWMGDRGGKWFWI